MDDLSTGSESDYTNTWISWFLSTKGSEYFAEVDEDYILDRFNLTGLNNDVVQEYSKALDLITDSLDDDDLDDDIREIVESSAKFLYGLIHARYIVTQRGLSKMLDKYRKIDFGRCPRVFCYSQPLLPVGLSDTPYQQAVKLYCPRCEDLYSPKSSRHSTLDGAYFGTTFPHLLLMVHPQLIPTKGAPVLGSDGSRMGMGSRGDSGSISSSVSTAPAALKAERYELKIFGFRLHEEAKLNRWRTAKRDEQIARLEAFEKEQAQPNL